MTNKFNPTERKRKEEDRNFFRRTKLAVGLAGLLYC